MKIAPASTTVYNTAIFVALALTLGACSSAAPSSATPATSSLAAAPAPSKPTAIVAAISTTPAPVKVAASIDFDKQVKPFFAEYCSSCHAGARVRRNVHVDTKAGLLAHITPASPDQSDLFNIISGSGKSMPPRSSPQPTAEDLSMIKQWITEGANISDSYPAGS